MRRLLLLLAVLAVAGYAHASRPLRGTVTTSPSGLCADAAYKTSEPLVGPGNTSNPNPVPTATWNGDTDGCINAVWSDIFWAPGATGPGNFIAAATAAIQSGQASMLPSLTLPYYVVAFNYPTGPDGSHGNAATNYGYVDVADAYAAAVANNSFGYGWGQIPPDCTWAAPATAVSGLGCHGAAMGAGHTCTVNGISYGPPCFEIQGVDFSGKYASTANAHTGGELVISSSSTPTTLAIYVHDLLGATTSTSTNNGMNVAGTTTRWINLQEGSTDTWTRLYEHLMFDGGGQPSGTNCNGARCTATVEAISDGAAGGGDRYIEYDVFLNTTGRPVTTSAMSPLHYFTRYNYDNSIISVDGSQDHGETATEAAAKQVAIQLSDTSFNVCNPPSWTPPDSVTACFWQTGGFNDGIVVQNTVNDNNLTLGNNSLVDTACSSTFTGQISGTTLTITSGSTSIPASSTSSGVNCDGAGSSGQGYVLTGASIPLNTWVVSGSAGTYTLCPPPHNPNASSPYYTCGTLSVGPESITAQYAYNFSAMDGEIGGEGYGVFVAHGNLIDPTGSGECFGAPNANNYGGIGTGSISGGVITWGLTPGGYGGPQPGEAVYVNGTVTDATVVSNTGSPITSTTISDTTLSYPDGTTVDTGKFTLQTADFGSGSPLTGGNGNLNLLTGELITGFGVSHTSSTGVGGNFGYAASGCTGALP